MQGGIHTRIIVEIQHPAHVHQFKNFINEMEKRGHETQIITTDKEITLALLDNMGLKYELIGVNTGGGLIKKLYLLSTCCLNTCRISLKFKPDIFISRESLVSGVISRFLNKPHISFADTDHIGMLNKVTSKLTDAIITPSCYRQNRGEKQIRIEGYKELAYLHPNYFTPNPEILKEIGLHENDVFIILRFVSWGATHDYGHVGLTLEDKRKAVKKFKKYGKVFITSEKPLEKEFEAYRINISPEKIHHLLYYATLLYGESATMASECAILGTHAIFCDYAGRGYTDEQEKKYGLVYNFRNEDSMGKDSLAKAVELLNNPLLKKEAKLKSKNLVSDKIDVTKHMVEFIENYG